MKQIVTAVLVIFAIAACIKSPESNDELSSASDPVLISHMDSICFFHNRVMDNIKLMTRSGELSVNPPTSVVPFSSAFNQDSHRQIFSSVISVHSLSKSSYHI